jgi:pyridoxine/pyridoxamine 5'-phosphate oxidase
MTMTTELDTRFSEATEATPWDDTAAALETAELYWLTTVREDGRPHTVPLVGVWTERSFVFCTGATEQKFRNLAHRREVTVVTGTNAWQSGLDVVVEGTAARVGGREVLRALADAYRAKYGDDWNFDADDEVFDPEGRSACVFRVTPAKVLAFAKSPHGQTRHTP